MALIAQALTTMKNARLTLNLYTLTSITSSETLTTTGNITYSFANQDLAPNQFGNFNEVSGTATDTVSTALITLDLVLGTITFSAERTGDITCDSYKYYNWNYDYDIQLERFINSSSNAISKYCNRNFIAENYSSEWHKTTNQELLLDNYPINKITFVKVNSATKTAGTDYITAINTYLNAGIIFKDNGWEYNGYLVGLVGEYSAQLDNIEVSYSAGYTLNQIQDIEDVCINIMSGLYYQFKRESVGLKKLVQGRLEYEWQNPKVGSIQDMLSQYTTVLNFYRKRVIR